MEGLKLIKSSTEQVFNLKRRSKPLETLKHKDKFGIIYTASAYVLFSKHTGAPKSGVQLLTYTRNNTNCNNELNNKYFL